MREAAFLAVLVLSVALTQESSIPCNEWIESWCDSKINAARENNAYLVKRTLALDLTTCLQARTQTDCSAKKNCFWFRGNDCIPRDLVP